MRTMTDAKLMLDQLREDLKRSRVLGNQFQPYLEGILNVYQEYLPQIYLQEVVVVERD